MAASWLFHLVPVPVRRRQAIRPVRSLAGSLGTLDLVAARPVDAEALALADLDRSWVRTVDGDLAVRQALATAVDHGALAEVFHFAVDPSYAKRNVISF